jgi:hypothetical protein
MFQKWQRERENLKMPIVDGHSLIPSRLRLDSIDDEMELVAILQEFAD